MSQIAIISDIHSNLEALETALTYLRARQIKEIYCLGDIVGYGPNPNECISLIKRNCKIALMGNHDFAAIGLANTDYFNEFARKATYWTIDQLTEENLAYLKKLPFTFQTSEYFLVHAAPANPVSWHYILSKEDAAYELDSFPQPVCFVGHSHVPVVFSAKGAFRENTFYLQPNQRYIVNVGSLGQPRDGNPDLSLCLYVTETNHIEYVRLKYDVEKTYKKIIEAGLPFFLADRLLKGY